MSVLRIAVIADIHAGETRSNIQSEQAPQLLENFVSEANARSVELIVSLGDNINAASADEDRRYLQRVAKIFSRSAAPVVSVFGNNELKFLGRSETARILDCTLDSEIRDASGWSLIFWRPDCELSLTKGLILSDDDLAWLDDALSKAKFPAVLFVHAPIDDHSMVGNYYFENHKDLATYTNGRAARALLEQSGKVVLVLSGHTHWHACSTIGGIHYRTIPSLTDTFEHSGEASEAWAILDLTTQTIALEVFGREPMRWSVPVRAQEARWRAPMSRSDFDNRMQTLWSKSKDPQ
ncbi:metallophosphoesterase [Microvirga sp. VF16]|uniref:metallophosphoesterase family protein n=1 Tax=Microvirga sp. VF16 TaxID=2807101 RepID=UPI00193CEA41|nr:metallophosphoesterase [Microvirga sp. VF16]QRM32382.1 metallophosphoesterase family protein [Microvirga sp. VF16]